MGGDKKYQKSGGFSEQTYKQVGVTSNGIKVLEKLDGSRGLPKYSNTPHTMYASKDSAKGFVKQISVYGGEDGRIKIKDIDYGHEHTNPDGKHFGKWEIHVQSYDANGKRSNIARKPSKKEKRLLRVALYGGN